MIAERQVSPKRPSEAAPGPKKLSARSIGGAASRAWRAAFSCASAWRLPAIWLILTMVFMLVHIVPGDPVQQMLGEDARPEDLNNLRHVLGLDQPHASLNIRIT